jgi:hypothetical protein
VSWRQGVSGCPSNRVKTAELTIGFVQPLGGPLEVVCIGCAEDREEAALQQFHPGNDGRPTSVSADLTRF